ncbi:MAG: hypothetical protein K2O54_06940, partial [Prevotella sp.]|nr:hypothetical protein [Prevotella sp.]
EWICGDLIQLAKSDDYWYILHNGVCSELYEKEPYPFRKNDVWCEVALAKINPKTVGEYTGLTERSGVDCIKVKGLKVFEDDIVRVLYTDWGSKDANDTRTLEEYLRDIAGIGVVKRTEYGEWRILVNDYLYPMDCGKYGYIEVIGNIHDTPELLENKQ